MGVIFLVLLCLLFVGHLVGIARDLDRRDAAWLANLQEMAQGYGRDVEERPARDLVEVVKHKIWPPEAKRKQLGFLPR